MSFSVACSIFAILCISINTSSADDEEPIITLPNGQIRGHVLQSENKVNYYAYQEIPYASPPVDELRLKDPIPPSNWDDILDTTKNTKICYQQLAPFPIPNVVETEDCLYLNVYTTQAPNDSPKTLLPVFVYIHGGAYRNGGGTFQQHGPKFFIDYNIIIVTMNYRLGPLGFLSTGDGVIPGNFGLKDQNLALKWVRDNIKLFGGDSDRVTIGGESAGAFSVSYHLISQKSKGLFRAAIQQSGSAICPISYQPSFRYIAFNLGEALDPSFASKDSTDLLNLLREKSAAEITSAKVYVPEELNNADALWAPVIEVGGRDEAFLTAPMHDLISNGKVNQVPLLLGYNSEEEVLFATLDLPLTKRRGVFYDEDLSRITQLTFNMSEENRVIAGTELRKIYTGGNFEDDFSALVRFMSDFRFTTPIIRDAYLRSHYSDVYLYELSYKGKFPGTNIHLEGVDTNSVAHAEDLLYIWDIGINSISSLCPEDDLLTRSRILKMWSNFIKYLNPTPRDDDLFQNVIWKKVSSDEIEYLNINDTLEILTEPKEYKKWSKILDDYAIPPLTVY